MKEHCFPLSSYTESTAFKVGTLSWKDTNRSVKDEMNHASRVYCQNAGETITTVKKDFYSSYGCTQHYVESN